MEVKTLGEEELGRSGSIPQHSIGLVTGNYCNKESELKNEPERMMKWFSYEHLPEHLQEVSRKFYELARDTCSVCDPGPERTVALRKLLEAKDAAVRAKLNPGC